MTTTFSQVARDVAGKYLALATIKSALDHVGARVDHPLAELDVDRRLQLTSQFVRALRDVGVTEANRIEQALFEALGAAPTKRRSLPIKDAISLITVRNHVHQLATALGIPWSEGMQVQSALSDVARHVSTAGGGGRLELEASPDGRIHVEVWSHRPLDPVSIEPGATPTWLIGVAKLSRGLRAASAPDGGTHLELWIARTVALVA
ncbi:MAG: hypothetical protein QM820_15755 [Minicystis sp.]